MGSATNPHETGRGGKPHLPIYQLLVFLALGNGGLFVRRLWFELLCDVNNLFVNLAWSLFFKAGKATPAELSLCCGLV